MEQLRELENNLQFKLPESFKNYWLKNINLTDKTYFILKNEICSISKFGNLDEIIEYNDNISELEIIKYNKVFCIGETIGSSVICMGYGQDNLAKIFLVDFGSEEIHFLSNNILEFVSSLKCEEELNDDLS